MKTTQEIYSEYKIMPTLALHQMRVAAVAKLICDSIDGGVDTESVVTACLFHDMGNIIKSDLNRFPDFLEPEGLEYWQKVKDEYLDKYGKEEHFATEAITNEIGLPDKVQNLIKKIGFSNLSWVEKEGTIENKICSYADLRVGPYGILSIDERLAEARKRYLGRDHSVAGDSFETLSESLRNIEKELFSKISLKPEDIRDDKIKNILKNL